MMKATAPLRIPRGVSRRCVSVVATVVATVVALSAPVSAVEGDPASSGSPTHGSLYLDVGYLLSSNRPGNHEWRSKGTTPVLDRLAVNNAAVGIEKVPAPESRWGFTTGLQAGRDVDKLVSSAAVGSAETLKHLYYTQVSYLFDVGSGLVVGGGLMPGHIGYESFRSLDNPTYTRVYGADNVPYFNWGVSAKYAEGQPVSATLLVVNGWDYLARPNDVPSYGLQLTWQPADQGWVTQNFYYGPDQPDTATEYWRFVTNTLAEWRVGAFLLAGSIGYGAETQAGITGDPRYDWAWGAVWIRWWLREAWHLTLRPEVFRDDDGLITSARQTIRAVTLGLEYRLTPGEGNDVSCRLEYRFDRSTGPDGGFFDGDANELVPEQQLLMGAVVWQFDSVLGSAGSRD